MADFTKYTTTEGDRWDNIAYKVYGTVDLTPKIIEANPKVPIYDDLPGGIELLIPVIEIVEADETLLPPWKR